MAGIPVLPSSVYRRQLPELSPCQLVKVTFDCTCRYDLGKGEWSNPDGCGQGEGEIHLRCTYTPFEMMARHPAESVTVCYMATPQHCDLSSAKTDLSAHYLGGSCSLDDPFRSPVPWWKQTRMSA